MNNQQRNGNCRRNGGFGFGQGQGRGCGRHLGQGLGNCKGNGQGRGKRRELFEEKFAQYSAEAKIPEFETQDDYQEWLNTAEGKIHAEKIQQLWDEVDSEIPWGGRRENAGRKKDCLRKVPFNRRISQDVLEKLKTFAKENNMTETEALEKAISDLK